MLKLIIEIKDKKDTNAVNVTLKQPKDFTKASTGEKNAYLNVFNKIEQDFNELQNEFLSSKNMTK